MAETSTYKRPPVPSAEESARAGWIAPLVAVALGVFILKPSPDPAVKMVIGTLCCLIFLFGLAASIWGFYVASFFGPRKHIVPAIVGFTLNACFVGCLVVSIQAAIEAKADHERASRETPAVAQSPQGERDRY